MSGFPEDDGFDEGGDGLGGGPATTGDAGGSSSGGGGSSGPVDNSTDDEYAPTAPGVVQGGPSGGGGGSGYVPPTYDDSDDSGVTMTRQEASDEQMQEIVEDGYNVEAAAVFRWPSSDNPEIDYEAIFATAAAAQNALKAIVDSPAETAVTANCATEEEAAPEPVTGGTHYVYIETDNIQAYSGYRSTYKSR